MNTEEQQNKNLSAVETSAQTNTQVLEITDDISTHLQTTGRWGQFLAIVGFVGMGFMVFAGFFMGIAMAVIPGDYADTFPFPPVLIGVFYLLMALVYLFPLLYLLRFSNSIKRAVQQHNQAQLAKAFTNLKSHYKSIGIIMLVFLCLYPILIIGMIVFGIFSGMSGAGGFPA